MNTSLILASEALVRVKADHSLFSQLQYTTVKIYYIFSQLLYTTEVTPYFQLNYIFKSNLLDNTTQIILSAICRNHNIWNVTE